MKLNLTDPILDILEAFILCAIVSQNDTHGSLIVCLGDGAEPLLTGCVPNLQLNVLAIDLHSLDLEIDSYKEN
jgi:hypothetical protein